MKKTLLMSGLAALTMAAAGGVALAQQAPDRPARALGADADRDGRISQAEFVNQRLQRLTAADIDGDGAVTTEERRAAAQARMAARADARFARLDADGDGTISRAEFDAGSKARADGARPVRANRGPGRMGKGAPGAARAEARGPVVIADMRTRAEQAFARLDADGDGFVTAAERNAGRQAMREQRGERMSERRAQRQASRSAPASE